MSMLTGLWCWLLLSLDGLWCGIRNPFVLMLEIALTPVMFLIILFLSPSRRFDMILAGTVEIVREIDEEGKEHHPWVIQQLVRALDE